MQSDAFEGSDNNELPVNSGEDRQLSHSPNFKEEREELAWVLHHLEISRSESLVRFLSYICQKYFDGESKDIREYSVAVEALGRRESNFDSHVDPIVRVTARALRKKLQEIYSNDGKGRRLQIMLPLGHYVPQFVPQASPAIEPEEALPLDQQQSQLSAQKSYKEFFYRTVKRRAFWEIAALLLAIPLIFIAGFIFGKHTDQHPRPVNVAFNWGEPVWSDEFNGAAHQMPDSSNWTYDIEPPAGIQEREVYCAAAGGPRECDPHHPNAFQDGAGHLVLRAQKNSSGLWTLVRITTHGLKSFQYGRIEARMKMPVGTGLWPTFLMVGANKETVGWPASGSVDIAENVSLVPGTNGLGPTMIRSTMHGPRYFGANGLWHDFKLPNGGRVDDDSFHTYGIIWSPGMIQFYVDDPANIYFVQDASDLPEGGEWVFDHPFFLMMSLGVGGEWPGNSDATTPNPADILVDYVRVYKIPTAPAPSIEWQSMNVKSGSSASSAVTLRSTGYAGRVHLACSTDSPSTSCSLATSVVNLSNTLSQEDTLTLSTDAFTGKGHILASPGRYKVTITATTISGDHSQLTVPFEVKSSE